MTHIVSVFACGCVCVCESWWVSICLQTGLVFMVSVQSFSPGRTFSKTGKVLLLDKFLLYKIQITVCIDSMD